jgi:hypothetical protein
MRADQRPTSLLARWLALGTVILVALQGCGIDEGDPPTRLAETEGGVATTEEGESGFEESDSEQPDAMVTPRPGMVDVEPVRIWLEYGSWDGELMYVTFLSKGEPCEVLDRIEIDETETRVTVTLYQGRDPDMDPDEPCDGPLKGLQVVLPPLQRSYGPEEGSFVNGANSIDSP